MNEHTIKTAEHTSIQRLKRRLAALKGWIKRRQITLLNRPRYDANYVEYQGRYLPTKAWYRSPGGRDDAELVRKFMDTKTQLEKLGVL